MKAVLKGELSLVVEEGQGETGGQGAASPAYPLYLCGPGTSSFDAAWELLAEGRLPVWGAVLMESQSGGRGRMGRIWQSPPGHVYGALRLPQAPPFDGPGASLALALLLSLSLERLGLEVEIKWPNDLIYEGGKSGGILLESKPGGLVAGVGLNLKSPPVGSWTAERDDGAPVPSALPLDRGPEEVWAALVKNIILLYKKKFGCWSMAEAAAAAEKRLFWRGRRVRVITPASEPQAPPSGLRGRLEGLAPDGGLLLVNEAGRYKLWSGTVCLE